VIAAAAIIGVLSYAAAVAGVVALRSRGPEARFQTGAATTVQEPGRSIFKRAFFALGRRSAPMALASMTAGQRRKARERIDAAGRPYGVVTLDDYVQRRGALMVIGGALGLYMIVVGSLLPGACMIVVGLVGMDVLLDGAARRRQGRIDRDLPDFLDILSVCVNAGIAFRPAMARVADAIGGPLGDEIQTALRQISLGATRRAAFDGLRTRNTSEPMRNFVTAFLQAEELGVPLADALVDLSRDLRRDAAQRARRRAQNAVPRVSLVVVVTILPAAVLLLVASFLLNTDFSTFT
jgi:tight adherence protein C